MDKNRKVSAEKSLWRTIGRKLLMQPTKLSSGNAYLDKVRDCFIFQIYTALRISDAKNLRETDIVSDESSRLWVTGFSQKSSEALRIPLLPPARLVYDKYSEYRKTTGFVLPLQSHQKYNVALKFLGELVGLPAHKKLHSHVARHTAATTILLGRGVGIKETSAYLGHASIRSTEHYARISKQGLTAVAEKLETIHL